eukprot:SAG11_NODE_54_length_19571_cov_29.437786_9_plen_97_part_00
MRTYHLLLDVRLCDFVLPSFDLPLSAVASNARTEIETAVKAAAQKAMQDAERRAEARVDQVRMEGEEQVRLAREETVSAVKSLGAKPVTAFELVAC